MEKLNPLDRGRPPKATKAKWNQAFKRLSKKISTLQEEADRLGVSKSLVSKKYARACKEQNAPPLTEERGKAQSEVCSDSSMNDSSTSSALGGEVREKSEG